MAAFWTQLVLLMGALVHAAPASPPAATAKNPVVVAQFPNETWVENLAVRSNGKVLATILFPYAAVYQVDPCAPDAPPQLVSNITEASGLSSVFGIAEYQPDVFAVIVSNFSLPTVTTQPKSNSIWKVNMTAFDAGHAAGNVLSKLANIPAATTLNGLVTSGPDGSTLLATDSAGAIFAIDTRSGTGRVVLSSTTGTPELGITNSSHPALGPNGIRILRNELYVVNSNAQTLLRFPLTSDGIPASKKAKMIGSFPTFVDDIEVASDGTVFAVTNPANSLDAVSPKGQERQILGGLNSSVIVGGTSVRFGRTRDAISTLYISTTGGIAGPLNGTFIEGGQVVAVQTNKKAA